MVRLFWHGPTKTDMEWLNEAVSALKHNEWTNKPLYFDGANWPDDLQREHAVIMLLNALRYNTSSQKLIFQNVALDLKAQAALTQSMQDNKSLINITLKQLTCHDHHAGGNGKASPPLTIPTGVFENPRLECLTIDQCRLDYPACLALAHMIHHDPNNTSTTTTSNNFTTLSLNQVDIAPEGLSHLFMAIAQSTTLHHLKLSNLSWKSTTAISTSASAQQENDTDDTLIIAATTREFLIMAAVHNTSLVSLSLERMQLNQALIKEVAAVIKRNATNLEELSLRHNNLNGNCIQVLVQDGLVHNNKLQRLFLSHNPVGDDGAAYLMQGLTHNTTIALQELCLVETEIWDTGCMSILHGLRVGCRTLRKVHLDRNNFETSNVGGPMAIVTMLQENMVLYSLLETLPFLLRKQKECSSDYANNWRQVDFMLRSNKTHRRFFMQQQYESEAAAVSESTSSSSNVVLSPSLLVPRVLTLQDSATGTSASSQPDVLYSFLLACLPQTLMSRTTTTTAAAAAAAAAAATGTTTTDNPQEYMVFQQQQDDDDGACRASPPPTCGTKRRLRLGSSSFLPVIARIRRSSTPPSA